MPTFNEARALTSRKHVAEKGMNVQTLAEKHKLLFLHSPIFAFKKIPSKVLIFLFFISKETIGGLISVKPVH